MNQLNAVTAWTSASSVPVQAPMLLLIDDDRVMLATTQEMLERQGYKIRTAHGGEEAFALLAEHYAHIDAVILDREMPGFDGMEMVRRMKADVQLNNIPIIMLTGTEDQEKIQEGIDAGVYYYLVKPADNALLENVVGSALRERRQKLSLIAELNRHGAALRAMNSCQISVQTLQEAEHTSCFLATCFPNPERVVAGLMELLVNAVEHGNLGISYDEKHKLLAENRWREEIDRRAGLPEYKDKITEVTFQRKNGCCLVQITDSGPGFDWKRYWHINPARATASNGRGITRARLMAFDRMSYNEQGNSVTIMVSEARVPFSDYAW